MEESLIVKQDTEGSPSDVNALTLAYLGDAVFELSVREHFLRTGSQKVEKLHKRVTAFVNAGSQSRLFGFLEPLLTEEETAVYRRGRNSKTVTAAKNQKLSDYRRATGFEAVFGYLFLKDDRERMEELLSVCFAHEENEKSDRGTAAEKN